MVAVLLLLVTLAGSALSRPGHVSDVDSKIEGGLHASLRAGNTTNIFVEFIQGTQTVLAAISDTRFPNREDRLKALAEALEENAYRTQVNVISYVSQFRAYTYESYWINNQVYIRDADLSLVEVLVTFLEVLHIFEEKIFVFDDPTPSTPIIDNRENVTEWGIQRIQAEEAQMFLNNTTTNPIPIRVATIDTGVRHTHEALRENYLGDFGWFDPYQKTELPNDQNGHGTHTMGTICGAGGIGVYPAAKWLACKGCDTLSCAMHALISCGQFLTCPTLPDGIIKDCSKAPHLISNSWGAPARGYGFYDDVIAAWHVGEIIPVFSIGNTGPNCDTAKSPGDRDVIGVGSTTSEDKLSSFSSVGPSADGKMKPEVTAPGSDVISAFHTADNAYRSLSGTSMACPHTSGLVAILLAFKSDTTFDQVRQFLFTGAETEALQSSGETCYQLGDNVFPNYHFGQGRINALLSLKALVESQS